MGNRFASTLNALAQDYELATKYPALADRSKPNYGAMQNGDFQKILSSSNRGY